MNDPCPESILHALQACHDGSPAQVLSSRGWSDIREHTIGLAFALADLGQVAISERVSAAFEDLDRLLNDAVRTPEHPIRRQSRIANLIATLNAIKRFLWRHPVKAVVPPREEWSPPDGFVGTKKIIHEARFQKHGKNPPRSTIDVWRKAARSRNEPIQEVHDPATRELYLREEWVMDQISKWSPRKRNNRT